MVAGTPTLDIDTLERALAQLDTSLEYCRSEVFGRDQKLAEVLRAAAIQGFESTYELSHKVLRRYLAATEPSPPLTYKLSFPELIRLADDRNVLLGSWSDWAEYRPLRSLTSHTYHAGYAAEVFAGIPAFAEEVRHMLAVMRRSPPP